MIALLIEDADTTRHIVSINLDGSGYREVVHASDGTGVLDVLSEYNKVG